MKFVFGFILALLTVPAFAQTTKESDVFTAKDIKTKLALLEEASKVSGSGGAKLGDYGNHSIALSVRNTQRRSRGPRALRRYFSGYARESDTHHRRNGC